jgi:hypothetical protein
MGLPLCHQEYISPDRSSTAFEGFEKFVSAASTIVD